MRLTKSLCPECLAIIDASIIEENGKMIMEKTCEKHGGIPNIEFTVHPHCGTGTYVYIEQGKMIPITALSMWKDSLNI